MRRVEESYGVILDSVVGAFDLAGLQREATDLTRAGRKFGGCSQRRLRRTVLHHGTILYNFDLAAVSRYLREPKRQPAHRQGRTHEEFLTNLPLDRNHFAERLAERFPGGQAIS